MNIKLLATSFLILFSALEAEVEYEIQDIGTLQTRSSQAIALNNQGQILGWYNVDGTVNGKHLFVRNRDGSFHEIFEDPSIVYENIPQQHQSIKIDWRYLTDEGKAFGTLTLPNATPILFMWDKHNGMVKLGVLPGKEISAINNAGQVLIKCVESYNQNGKIIRQPVIWENGNITKLKGLEGNIGIESEESYGLDMNNHGDVVGQSVVYISYKNDIYKQVHAVKWINGDAFDLHTTVPKAESTSAATINDLGDVTIGYYLLRADGKLIDHVFYLNTKPTDTKFFLIKNSASCAFLDRDGKLVNLAGMKAFNDHDCIWMMPKSSISMNDNGEVVSQGRTIFGEEHAMLLTPVKPK